MKFSGFLAACLLLAATPFATASEPLTVVTEEFAPYNYTENGKLTGYSVKIVEELLRRADYNYTINSYPWARAYKMAQQLPNVMIFTMARTPEREADFYWIGELADRKLYFYKLKSRSDIVVNKLDDVKKYKVGVNLGDAAEKLLLQEGFTVGENIDESPKEISSLNKLLAKRVDFIVGNDNAVDYLVRTSPTPTTQLERSLMLINEGKYYIAMSKQTSPKLVKELQNTYAEMVKEGKVGNAN
jgi:polar amino acid transport system substrate-binding protein